MRRGEGGDRLSQMGHWKGRWPLWMRACRVSSSFRPKAAPHTRHRLRPPPPVPARSEPGAPAAHKRIWDLVKAKPCREPESDVGEGEPWSVEVFAGSPLLVESPPSGDPEMELWASAAIA